MDHSLLFNLIIFCSTAVILVPIFRKLKLSPILAYLFGGILIGPSVLGWIEDPETILHFSELGVVFLLFMIGLELSPSRLWKLRHSIFGLGLLQVLLTAILFYFIARALGLSPAASFVIGAGLSLSSTAFSIQILGSYRQLNTIHGQGSFSILMFQDLAVIPILAILSILEGKAENSITFFGSIKMIAGLSFVYFFGRYAIRHVFRIIADPKAQEVFTAVSLLVVLGTAFLLENIGFTMGLGAFLAGVLLANSEYRHELESNLQPFKGLLLGLFFIAVGMSLDLQTLIQNPLSLIGICLSFMLLKSAVIFGLAKIFRYSNENARNMACTLPQGGEFAFVILSTALASSLIEKELSSLIGASVTLSMLLSPFIFSLNQHLLKKTSEISERPYDEITSESPEIVVAGFGRFGQIVSRFLNAEKIPYTILEASAQQVEIARKFGNRVFYGDASRIDILESAGCREAKLFVICIDSVEIALHMTKVVRDKFPHLRIIARARNREHAIKLMEMGVEDIIRDTYFSSLEASRIVLNRLDRDAAVIQRKIQKFIEYDEALLQQQYHLRHDEKGFISHTNKANKELEQILSADLSKDESPSEMRS